MLVENQRAREKFHGLTHLINKSMSFQRPLLLFACEVHNSLSNNRALESSRPRFILLILFNIKRRMETVSVNMLKSSLPSIITPKCETT